MFTLILICRPGNRSFLLPKILYKLHKILFGPVKYVKQSRKTPKPYCHKENKSNKIDNMLYWKIKLLPLAQLRDPLIQLIIRQAGKLNRSATRAGNFSFNPISPSLGLSIFKPENSGGCIRRIMFDGRHNQGLSIIVKYFIFGMLIPFGPVV